MTNMEMCDSISFQVIVQHVTLICRNYCSPYISHASVSDLHNFGGSDPYSLLLIKIFLHKRTEVYPIDASQHDGMCSYV